VLHAKPSCTGTPYFFNSSSECADMRMIWSFEKVGLPTSTIEKGDKGSIEYQYFTFLLLSKMSAIIALAEMQIPFRQE
jgi:hypothetical protein